MAAQTSIEWCHHTFNPWIGCLKVHAGCTNCYAESFSKRTGKAKWGADGTRVKTSDDYWRQPLKWNRAAEKAGERRRVFCASMADVFEDWQGPILDHHGARLLYEGTAFDGKPFFGPATKVVSRGSRPATMDDLRCGVYALIDATPWLDWLVLTKRPENVRRMWLPYVLVENADGQRHDDVRTFRPNVWIGTSISDRKTAEIWLPRLLALRDLTPVLFVSAEPLLGPIDFSYDVDWVIVGGESGPRARPCRQTWIRDIVRQCADFERPCFVKQFGSNAEEGFGVHRKLLLKDSKGGDPTEWPEDLRVRQFPNMATVE